MSDELEESEPGLGLEGTHEDRVRGERVRGLVKKTGRPVGSKNRTVTQILADGNPDVVYTMYPVPLRGRQLRGLLQ